MSSGKATRSFALDMDVARWLDAQPDGRRGRHYELHWGGTRSQLVSKAVRAYWMSDLYISEKRLQEESVMAQETINRLQLELRRKGLWNRLRRLLRLRVTQ